MAKFNFFKSSIKKKDLQHNREIDITDDSLKGIGATLGGMSSSQYDQYLNTAPDAKRSEIYDSVDFIDKHDEIISKLLSDMADDATQYSYQTKSPIWVTSDDDKLEEDLNKLIERLDLKIKATNIVREIIKYGDSFGRLVIDPDVGIKRLLMKHHPADVCRLEYKGELAGWKVNKEFTPLQRFEMIHWRSLEEHVADDILNEVNKDLFERYFLDEQPSYGKSYIFRAISISKRLKYAEDALLLGRLSKSRLYRNHFVEVGTGTLPEKVKIIREYVRNWRKNSVANTDTDDMYSDKNFFSYEEDVFHPVTEGKGSSNIEQIGGDMDIAHIEDIDYFKGKRDKVIGVSSDEDAMTNRLQDDSKYAKKVASYQKYLLRGLYELMDIHLDIQGKFSEERKYTINLVEVDSYIETERNEMLSSSADFVEQILSLVSSIETDKVGIDTEYLIKYLFSSYLRLPEMDYEMLFIKPEEADTDIIDTGELDNAEEKEQKETKPQEREAKKDAEKEVEKTPEDKVKNKETEDTAKPVSESIIAHEQRFQTGMRHKSHDLTEKKKDDKATGKTE